MKKLIVTFVILLSLVLTSCSTVDLYIGENGNWWNGDEDLGIAAQGPQGEQGPQGVPGEKGDTGETGESVTVVSVTKTKTEGSVDTYTIYFSDNSFATFTVTNGADGKTTTITSVDKISTEGLIDTYKITFSDKTSHTFTVENGEDGKSITVASIGKVNSVGLIDTYEIVFSDGTKSTFTVTNGRDGNSPYIGVNGNWWIGGEDTGILADYSADDRKISDGLLFVTATVGGKVGFVVSDYEGSSTDVVIPNYIGSVPVIGISNEAFKSNTTIKSISFSKNTAWLEESVFSGCSNLENIDFNGAKLTEIPAYAFEGCAIHKINLPETITKLGDEAFDGCELASINYENITYFGKYALNDTLLPYIFLSNDVEYVGNYAFNETFVYIEHETIPPNWGSDISPITVVKTVKSGDYIYSISDNKATIHRYIGANKRITIPESIDGYTVTAIGFGFDSYSEYLLETALSSGLYFDVSLEEVIIPKTVSKIEGYTFMFSRSFIYIPNSIQTMSWNLDGECYELAFYALETDEYPFGEYNEDNIRIACGINYDNVVYDEVNGLYLYEDLFGYSILASRVRVNENIVIPSEFNGKNIHTIRTRAYLVENVSIKISNGISKIQKYAFIGDIFSIYIPKSVNTINAYGVSYADYYCVEAKSKPDEWDTYWNGNRTTNVHFDWNYEEDNRIDAVNKVIYKIENDCITLIKYLGSNSTLYIPRTIEGYTVTKIATGFYSSSGTRYIYIPKEIEVIEANAFTNTSSSYFYFYFETKEQPINWSSDWYYNTYYASNTSRITKYWNQKFSY